MTEESTIEPVDGFRVILRGDRVHFRVGVGRRDQDEARCVGNFHAGSDPLASQAAFRSNSAYSRSFSRASSLPSEKQRT